MEERKRSKRMASANSRAITKCQLVDECPMFKRKINLTGSKRKMSNISDKEIIFSKPSSTTTITSINDMQKDQVVDLKQVIKKPVLAVPPMPFNLQESKPLKHFRTYEPIHSKFPNSQSFNSLDFSLLTKKVKAKRIVAQVRPFNKTSLDNRVKEVKSTIHKNSLMNINGMNNNLQQDTNLDRKSVQVKVKVEQNDVIPKSRVKIRSSQCSKLIQKVTKSYKLKYIRKYKDAKQQEKKHSDYLILVKNGGWKVGGISYKQLVYINDKFEYRTCYPTATLTTGCGKTRISRYDCVKIKSHDDNDFVGKVIAIWTDSNGEIQLFVIWFYEPVKCQLNDKVVKSEDSLNKQNQKYTNEILNKDEGMIVSKKSLSRKHELYLSMHLDNTPVSTVDEKVFIFHSYNKWLIFYNQMKQKEKCGGELNLRENDQVLRNLPSGEHDFDNIFFYEKLWDTSNSRSRKLRELNSEIKSFLKLYHVYH